jgi:hypothetical protein
MEVIGLLIQVALITTIVLVLFHLPLWYIAKKKNTFSRFDYLFPFIPALFYSILNISGIGNQSLSNFIIELSIVISATVIGYSVKVFSVYKNSKIILGILLLFTLLLTLLMPHIAE